MTVCREPEPAEKIQIPPPTPVPAPTTCVALLFRTWLVLIDILDKSATQIPPPFPTRPFAPCVVLFWMMLFVIVGWPVPPVPPELALKMAIPPPFPSVVLQFVRVTLVNERFAVPLEPVSNSMQPPS